MSAKIHRVRLTKKQRKSLKRMTHKGVISARKLNRAGVLLLSDEARPNGAKTDQQIVEILGVSAATVVRIRRRFVQEGLEAALTEKPRPGKPKQLTGQEKASVIALACAGPPEGYARWNLRLLANQLVELELVESISHTTVADILKKTNLSLT